MQLLLLLLLPFPSLKHFPEPLLLLLLRQDGRVRHAGDVAAVEPTFLALAAVLDRHDAVAALLANEIPGRVVLVSSPEECSTAEANNTSIVADELLVLLGHVPAGEAVGQVVLVVRVQRWVIHFDRKGPIFRERKWLIVFICPAQKYSDD